MSKIAIVGAGSVGCFVGGHLVKNAQNVTFIGRNRLKSLIDAGEGMEIVSKKEKFFVKPHYVTEFDYKQEKPDFIIYTLKGTATEDAATELLQALDENYKPAVISLQNGLENPKILSRILGDKVTVVPAMFSFNVVQLDGPPIQFHQGTAGPIYLQSFPQVEPLIKAMQDSGMETHGCPDIAAIQYGKLLMNLNNVVNALSGIPLKQELSQRSYRRVVAHAITEALQVYAAKNIVPVSPTPLPAWTLPWLMSAPDFVFLAVARSTVNIDEKAHSSMYDDIKLGRPTEIDVLNGAISEWGKEVNVPTPVNDKLCELIRETSNRQDKSTWKTYTGEELLKVCNIS